MYRAYCKHGVVQLSMAMIRWFLLIAVVLGWSVSGTAADFHPTRLIIRLSSSASPASLGQLQSEIAATQMQPLFSANHSALAGGGFKSDVFAVEFKDSLAMIRAESRLQGQPGILYAERDYYMQLFGDPLFSNQWGLQNNGQEYYGIIRVPGSNNDTLKILSGKTGADINRTTALEGSTTHARVRVAIIDTGVDYKHPDLAANIWHNAPESDGRAGFDDDFNGYVDDVIGYDFSGDDAGTFTSSPDPDPMDSIGHGTHCAGIVGAVNGNGIGIEGIAPNVEIICLKIFPNALASASAQAIVYAVDNGAKVINASWGSPYFSSLLGDAVKYAADNGVIFVAAAGNSGTSVPFFPARLDDAFTVGATNSSDQVTSFSTFGNWLDISAPGQDILSLRANITDLYASAGEPLVRIIEDQYYLADGTSMAAPHVAGCAALILSIAPGLSPDSTKNLLVNTTDRVADPSGFVPSSYSPYGGWGRVNVGRAAALLADEYAEIESPLPNAIVSGVIRFEGSAFAAQPKGFLLEAKPASLGEWVTIATGSADIVSESIAEWDSSPFDGDTQLRLLVGDQVKYTGEIRLVNSTVVEIQFPQEDDTVFSAVEIIGSASVPEFVSYDLSYHSDIDPKRKYLISHSTKLVYGGSLAEWTVGPILPGSGVLELLVNTEAGTTYSASRHIRLRSAIAENYPRNPGRRPHYCSVAGDIDGNGEPDILTGARNGIIVNAYRDNTLRLMSVPGATSHESSPALVDFDGDGADEIVCVTDIGLAILNGAGELLPGWPKQVNTGYQYNAYPTPLVVDIDGDSTLEILIVNAAGEIYCWHQDGSSYFGTQRGLFARIENHGLDRTFGGSFVAFIYAHDFDRDGFLDVGTLYTGFGGNGGMYMYSGKNGAPLFPELGARVFAGDEIFGGVLADFDGDSVPEIAFAHWYSSNLAMAVSIVEADGTALPGWPKLFPDKTNYLTPYPAAADLDSDSLPELVCVFSALDGGEVYVWKGSGKPFLESDFGRTDGFFAGTTSSLSNPIILDVDNDGELEIVSRGGALFFGKPERLMAWNLDATAVVGWPIYTYADPGDVIYTPFTPVTGDFDGDGLLELYMGSSDAQLYCWDLPTPATDEAVAWGNFLRDNRHTGALPFPARSAPAQPPLPTVFRLGQNYPNPFNQSTVIELDMPKAGKITVHVINTLGQHVATITEQFVSAGFHRLLWNGTDGHGRELSSGVYFYRLRMDNYEETRRMVILK